MTLQTSAVPSRLNADHINQTIQRALASAGTGSDFSRKEGGASMGAAERVAVGASEAA